MGVTRTMTHQPGGLARSRHTQTPRVRTANIRSPDHARDATYFLQRYLGNRALQAMAEDEYQPSDVPTLQRACACGGTCASCAGQDHESEHIHPKLIVGQPGDVYEREADQVAETVMRLPEPTTPQHVARPGEVQGLHAQPLSTAGHDAVRRQPLDEEEEEDTALLQAKAISAPSPAVRPDLAARIDALHGGGKPLPATTRAFFEPRFGSDFSPVRIHTDARAAAAARAVQARAFTVGRDIVFGAGQYAPGTTHGQRLLAHELTHVVQQAVSLPVGIQRLSTDQDLEFKYAAQQTDNAESEPSALLDPQFWSDLIASIEESFFYAPEILGEVGQAILDHYILFTGAMLAFLAAEAAIGALAATPDPSMITKVVSAALQWLVFLFLAFFAAVEVYEAVNSATAWWTLVAQAKGDPAVIAEAAKQFCWMTFHIIMAILVAIGVRVRVPGAPGRAAGSAVESSITEAVEGSGVGGGAGGSSNVVELGAVRAAQTTSGSGGASGSLAARGGPIVEGTSALKFEPAFEPMTEIPLIEPPIEVGPLIETSPSVLANALKLAQHPAVTGAAVGTSASVLPETATEEDKDKNKSCCCCAEYIQLVSADPIDNDRMGHNIRSEIKLKYVYTKNGSGHAAVGDRDCKFEWWEKTDDAFLGAPVNQWYMKDPDTHRSFGGWQSRTRVDQLCPGEPDLIYDDDPASLPKYISTPDQKNPRGTRVQRNLEFRVLVRSAPGCDCTYDSYGFTAVQFLVLHRGNAIWRENYLGKDIETSYFRTPNEADEDTNLTVRRR